MPAQTLTEVAVEVFADVRRLKPVTVVAAREAGKAAGDELGDGISKGADKKIGESRGRFESAGKRMGGDLGKGFAGEIQGGTFAKVAATMAARFALMGGAAAAAAPGVAQFVGALAPAAGAAVALPAALLAIKLASAVTSIAVMGVGDAITKGFTGTAEEAKKALDDLSGNSRKFAGEVIALKSPLMDIKKTISDRFFLPLLDDVRPLAERYMPMLKAEAGDLAGPLGGLGEQIAKSARSADVFNGVRDLFGATRLSVINLRGSIDPLAKAFGALIQSTAPELPILADGFTNLSKRVAAYITAAVDSGRVNDAFDKGKQTLKDFGGILGNIGSIVKSVYGAATANGNTLLTNLRELTGQAAEFFRSAQGSSALTSVFETLSTFGSALRTSLGAVLPAIGASIEAIAPALAGLAGPASQIVVALAPLLPIVAGLAAQLITQLTPAIEAFAGWLARNEGAVKALVVVLAGYMAAQKLAAAITAVQGAGSIAKWIAQTTIASNVTKVFTALQYGLGAAMKFALGPVGLIIAAVAALVAGVVYAYNHHEGFRLAVQKVWAAIQAAVKSVVDWFTSTALPWMKNVWEGITKGAQTMWNVIRPVLDQFVSFFRDTVAPAALWLWHNVIEPAFKGIGAAISVGIEVGKVALNAIWWVVKNVIGPVVEWLWKNVVVPAFKAIGLAVKAGMAVGELALKALNTLLRDVIGPVVDWLWKTIVKPAFEGIGKVIKFVWENGIKPILEKFGGFIRDDVAPAFKKGTEAIGKAWDAIKELAKTPVNFVINSVINPLIGGFNKIAGVFGTTKIDKIPALAEGGRIPGNAGGRDDRLAQVMGRRGKLLGSIRVGSGEFVVNARDTARALPLLRWINGGMRGGPMGARQRIGRGLTERPGDGSEGWAFKRGGLVGFLDDVGAAFANPKDAILKPIEAAMKNIPGGGMIAGLLQGMGRKLANALISWIGGGSQGGGHGSLQTGIVGGKVGQAMRFVQAQAGKPYIWASAGPNGYDCSGIVSAAWNILHGRSPYSHTFSTGSLPGSYFPKRGPGGLLTAGWAHPGQQGASASVGHMAGQFFNGMSFESTGSRGVHVNSGRRPADFAHQGHFRHGGLLAGAAIAGRADFGSTILRPGWNLVENATGKPEPLVSPDSKMMIDLLKAILRAIREEPAQFAKIMGALSAGTLRQARRM